MPVTVYPASHESRPCDLTNLLRNASPEQVLRICTAIKTKNGQTNVADKVTKVWASSFDKEDNTDIYPSANGFVHAAIRAYNAHHHLRIRPDDIWIAILSQFSIYVNANAEKMRSTFVAHQGQKSLSLEGAIVNGFAGFADKVTEVLGNNVKDPSITPWIMQRFSTTSDSDRIAAGIIMMATFQKYFSYYDAACCGLPSVTLLGTRDDWAQILDAVERLADFGEQPATWLSVLKPVLSRFVRSFDDPTSVEIVEFWQQIADYRIGGSGADSLSGWLTAFCFWDEEGRCTHPSHKPGGPSFRMLDLDGIGYGMVDWEDVPPGWASVPLEIDLDEAGGAVIRKCRLLAGSVGITPFLNQEGGNGNSTSTTVPPKEESPRSSRQRQRNRSILHKLLSCCEPRRVDVDNDGFREPVEEVTLPPYPGGPKIPNLSKWDEPVDSYEAKWKLTSLVKGQGEAAGAPPEYRLDSLQPRVGWWLWEEGIVTAAESKAYGGK